MTATYSFLPTSANKWPPGADLCLWVSRLTVELFRQDTNLQICRPAGVQPGAA